MKHTPGPWHITHDTTPGEFVTLTKVRDQYNGVIAVMHVDAAPNSKLIAAAPDLLNMLQRLVAESQDGPLCLCTLEHARNAINKATK